MSVPQRLRSSSKAPLRVSIVGQMGLPGVADLAGRIERSLRTRGHEPVSHLVSGPDWHGGGFVPPGAWRPIW